MIILKHKQKQREQYNDYSCTHHQATTIISILLNLFHSTSTLLFFWSILIYIMIFTNKYFLMDVQLINFPPYTSCYIILPQTSNNSLILSNKQMTLLRWQECRQEEAKRNTKTESSQAKRIWLKKEILEFKLLEVVYF